MNYKVSLDRYLTTPLDDGYDGWCESVIDKFSNSFYDNYEQWINDYGSVFNGWLNKLFYKKNYECSYAANIIERAARRYINIAPNGCF